MMPVRTLSTNGGVIKAEVVFDTDQTHCQKGGAPALTMIDKGAGFDLSMSVNPTSLGAPGTLTYRIEVRNSGDTFAQRMGLDEPAEAKRERPGADRRSDL